MKALDLVTQLSEMPVDVAAWGESVFADPSQEPAVSALQRSRGSTTPRDEVSVMILCTDPIIAAGLAAVLRQCADFQVVRAPEPGDFGDGPHWTDVVVADYETAMRLAESDHNRTNNLLVFTDRDGEAEICRAVESGARGYLLYGTSLAELVEAIRSVHRGDVALSPLVAARITSRIKGKPLTKKEKAVLDQLMLGVSNKLIARRLGLCVGTVKTHVKAIMQKLEADSRTAAVVTAQRRGIVR